MLLPITRPDVPSEKGVPEMVAAGLPSVRVVPEMAMAVGLAVKVWEARMKMVDEGVGVGRGMVLLPMMRPEVPRRMGVPEIVIGGPPAWRVVPAMATPVGLAVKVWPPTVKAVEAAIALGIVAVELPTMIFEVPTETHVPEMVAAGPPAERVLPDMITPPGTAVRVWPATVKAEELGVGVGRAIVDVPTTRPELPNTIGVPDMVIAGPPGESVLPENTTPLGTAVKVCPAIVRAEELPASVGRATIDVPTTRPESPSETVAPGMVTAGAPDWTVCPATSTAPADEIII